MKNFKDILEKDKVFDLENRLNIENKIHEFKILNLTKEFMEVYSGNDWLVLKKYVLRYSHPDIRRYFSTRHQKSKKHSLNSFEKNLIEFCYDKYNKRLYLKEDDKHKENNEETQN